MTTETMTPAEETVKQASSHLYEAMTHHYGPLDLAAHQPIVKAILVPRSQPGLASPAS